jgi:tRNA A-37 threonylcarbamoyl transferase component Bud32
VKSCPQCQQRYPHESSFCFVDGASLESLPDPRLGTTLAGRYVLEEILGEGGMATVYRARHKLVDRPCAIKVLHGEVVRDPTAQERFRREARHAQRLAHPNIIDVFDQGETDDGTAFLVMELLEGSSLATLIGKGRINVARTIKLAAQMSRALARAHDFEVVHRDLKPENVFVLKEDRIKLLDFGIARSKHDSRLTSVGEIFGTPEYMAPEQGSSTEAGPSADIYSLGIILFEMLSGTLPFEAPNAPTMLVKHMSEPAPHVQSRQKDVPESLDRLIHDMMSKAPHDRPVDAQSVLARLRKIAEELRVELPAEIEAELPPPSRQLKAGEAQLWGRRAKLFEEMLKRGFPAAKPADSQRILSEIEAKVAEVETLRKRAYEEQAKLEIVEQEGREAYARFGQAMDTLTQDASRMREEVRDQKAVLATMMEGNEAFGARLLVVHKETVFWEGRSAFTEPYPELAKLYRDLASILDEWLVARGKQREIDRAIQDMDGQFADIDYQIKELRSGLDSHNREVEERREESRSLITEMGRKAEALEGELLMLATRFCAPLRAKPELVPLFRELEANG